MKKLLLLLMMGIFGLGCSQQTPKVLKKSFSKQALAQKLEDEDGKTVTIQQILDQHKGKVLVIDFWAGWCRDCLNALPKAKELEENNKNIDFVFLSLDRSKEGFERSLEKFEMKDKENYWFSSGWKNDFNNYVDLNWIPRYMVIDQKSAIAKYYAITPEDPEIQATIDQLLK
ncbi:MULTISPECIES: TlpA family protein disulfide reductase [Chryseobacterium]|uniref:TlpA family protein disulfide reductase n=1 Tax=Chryseobacterium TaxID=59732 RepID=UPI002273C178|nr:MULTISPECIES: thioredoxin family protein [Chryseobacterium]MCY1663405.1 thioredoxin family protein [Chryseobacterium sp. SL1]WBV54594.1 thioredoxin family protein [Chryseobacterium gambrini]WBX98995.1 thioredoxin family protein [Chryseobacterium gambrini]